MLFSNKGLPPDRRLESITVWSDCMKTSSRWSLKSIASKVLFGLALTAIIGSMNVAPSYADNNRNRERQYDRQSDNRRYKDRASGHDRYRHGGHGRWHDRDGYRYYEDGYRHRIYAPPPVFYTPPPDPGIRIFFPPVYINP